jgi:hypothetical protein
MGDAFPLLTENTTTSKVRRISVQDEVGIRADDLPHRRRRHSVLQPGESRLLICSPLPLQTAL